MAIQAIFEGTKDPLNAVLEGIFSYLSKSSDSRLNVARSLLTKITEEFKLQFAELFPHACYEEFENFMLKDLLPLTDKVASPSKSIIDRSLTEEEKSGIKFAVRKIKELDTEMLKIATHFSTKIVQGINIAQEVERINRVKNSDKAKRAYEGLANLEEQESFFQRLEIIVFTAHPNKAVSDSVQRLLNTITGKILDGDDLGSLISRLVKVPVLSETKPSPLDEAKSFIGVLRYSFVPGALEFLRNSREVMSRIGLSKLIDQIPEIRTWIGSDIDGRPEHTPEDLRAVLSLNRKEGVDTYRGLLRGMDVLRINQSAQFNESFDSLLERLEGARNLFESNFTSTDFVDHLDKLIELVTDDMELETELVCLREMSVKLGLSLVRHELRENSEVLDLAIEAVLRSYGHGDLEKELRSDGEWITKKEEKFKVIEQILRSGDVKEIQENPSFARLRGFLDTVREANEKDPGLVRQLIISLHEHPVHYLEARLMCRLCGIEDLPIVPLTETPEDLRKVEDVARQIFESSVSGIKDQITWMWGFSDSAMRGGFCSRELTREAPLVVSRIGAEIGIKVLNEEGRGPRSGRGGGLFTRFVWATPLSLSSGVNHVTVQGEGVQQLFGHPNMVQRTLSVGSEMFLASRGGQVSKEWNRIRREAFLKGEKAYEEFIDRVEQGDPQRVFEQLQRVIPLHALDLKTASRPLFRSLPVKFEKFRAVPNNIMSDVSRLCWVSLYGTGAMLEELTSDKNLELTKRMIKEDPEFQTDLDSLVLALQRADVPRVIAVIRAVYGEEIGELEGILQKIEKDYLKLYTAINKLKDAGALDSIFERRTFEAIREARTLKDPATNLFLICLMTHQDPELRKMMMVHNMLSVDSAG